MSQNPGLWGLIFFELCASMLLVLGILWNTTLQLYKFHVHEPGFTCDY
jgi:hypothetical protein